MKSLLSVQNLKVGIKQEREWIFPILDVNLEVGYRETVGLVGESGSGKSLTAMALLKLLSKLTTRIEAKKMQLGNINLLSAEKKLMQKVLGAQVGFVMQNAQGCLNPTMKIKDQIIESMLIHGIFSDKAQAIFESKRLLDLVEIQNSSHVLNCYP
ncbi:MAG: ABC transporter ATP-binding protein, partial [Chlamydiae bacterium]|nr:ABC transporter ATP-binding protein [Chlamydiota bacterium]